MAWLQVSDDSYYTKYVQKNLQPQLLLFETGEDIRKRWDYLRAKFTEEWNKMKAPIPSGAGGEQYVTTWPYYNSLKKFLEPHVGHEEMLSSMSGESSATIGGCKRLPPSTSMTFGKQRKNVDSKDIEGLTATRQILNNTLDLTKATVIHNSHYVLSDKYMPMIKETLSKVPEDKKCECSIKILERINQFQATYCKRQ